MRRFFNSESFLWRPLGVLGDLVVLSLLWTVLSLPLVTLGPASAALYDAAVHGLRQREGASLTRFLSTFRRELKEGVLSSLFWLGLALALGLALWATHSSVLAWRIPGTGEPGGLPSLGSHRVGHN